MKKIFAAFLTAAMLTSLAVPALADETATPSTKLDTTDPSASVSNSIGVSGDYTPQNVNAKVSVDVAWSGMNFTYIQGQQGTWNPDTLRYDDVVEAHWKKDESATITVTNHSNVDVSADFTVAKTTAVENLNIKGVLDQSKLVITSAENKTVAEAPKGQVKLSVDPTSDGIGGNYAGILTVTVTIGQTAIINATGMQIADLTAAITAQLNKGVKKFDITLTDSDAAVLNAIPGAFSESAGNIDLTVRGVTTLQENFFTKDNNPVNKFRSIYLPDVTSLPTKAFYECTNLVSVDAPKVTTIGNSALHGCSALTSVNLPAATTVGDYAFSDCSALVNIDLSAATTIGVRAFFGCGALTDLSLTNVTTIEEFAFVGCYQLRYLALGELTSVAQDIFGTATIPNNIHLTLSVQQKVLVKNEENRWVTGEGLFKDSESNLFMGSNFVDFIFVDYTTTD